MKKKQSKQDKPLDLENTLEQQPLDVTLNEEPKPKKSKFKKFFLDAIKSEKLLTKSSKKIMSIKSKVVILCSCLLVVCSLILTIISCVFSYKTANSVLNDTMTQSAKLAAGKVLDTLNLAQGQLEQLASNQDLVNGNTRDPNVKAFLKSFQDQGIFKSVYATDANGISNTGYDCSQRDYFSTCKDSNKPIITAFEQEKSGEYIFSIVVPILKNNSFNGIVCGTASSDVLANVVKSLKFGETGHAFVIDSTGNVIAHPDGTIVTKGTNYIQLAKEDKKYESLANTCKNMVVAKEGYDKFKYDGKYTIIAYSPINCSQCWSIALMADFKDFTGFVSKGTNVIIIISILSLIFSIVLLMFLCNKFINPIKQCANRLELLAQGDLTTPVPEPTSKDETYILLSSMKNTVTYLNGTVNDITNHLDNISKGDLTQSLSFDYSGDFMPIQKSIVSILQSLNKSMNNIYISAEQVASGSEQVASGAQQSSEGATEQASLVEELSASIQEISDHIKKTSENAANAKVSTDDTSVQVDNGHKQMQLLSVAMDNIADSSNEIREILKTIDDIAFQTNILSINAAIEAASAGEAGKGFAVVADEVRSLAAKSADAAKSTEELINKSQSAIQDGNKTAMLAADSLDIIVDKTKNIASLVNDIAIACNQQAESVNQITIGMDQISGIVQTNSATSQQSAAASEELSEQAQSMKDLVSQFKTIKDE